MQKILLISGWGLGLQPLAGLKTALENLNFQVKLIDIFDSSNPAVLEGASKAVKADILMGWSLGGQLATILAQRIFEQTGGLKFWLHWLPIRALLLQKSGQMQCLV